MKVFKGSLLKLEYIYLLRTKSVILGIFILFFGGVSGLYFGNRFMTKQQDLIHQIPDIQKEILKDDIKKYGTDLGDFLYTYTFPTVHMPSHWSAFANGQRDVHSFVLPVTMRSLENQMYDTDLINPVSQLFGNLDLSFVFIFLFPLIFIAISYNVWSSDQESGTWQMVRAQSIQRVFWVLIRKLCLRFVLVLFIAYTLLLMAFLYLHLPFDLRLGVISITLFCYMFFWFAVLSMVISLNRSSIFNAISLLSFWVLVSVFIPAVLNVVLTDMFPVPEALSTVVQQRESYHEKWDQPKDATMLKFYQHYPALKQYPLATDKFTWGWFYAMQQMGDDESKLQSNRLLEKLQQRQQWTKSIGLIFPTISTQLQFNQVAQTDLQSHIDFLTALKRYHEQIRTYFYPIIFKNGSINDVDFNQLPVFEFYGNYPIDAMVWIRIIISLSIGLLLLCCAYFNIQTRLARPMKD